MIVTEMDAATNLQHFKVAVAYNKGDNLCLTTQVRSEFGHLDPFLRSQG